LVFWVKHKGLGLCGQVHGFDWGNTYGVSVSGLNPVSLTPSRLPPIFDQQETRLCARFAWYRQVQRMFFVSFLHLPPFNPQSKNK